MSTEQKQNDPNLNWAMYNSDKANPRPQGNKAQHSPKGLYIQDIEVANYCDNLRNHADKLAEALRAVTVRLDAQVRRGSNDRTVAEAEQIAREALAAYEASKQ